MALFMKQVLPRFFRPTRSSGAPTATLGAGSSPAAFVAAVAIFPTPQELRKDAKPKLLLRLLLLLASPPASEERF